MNEGKVAGYYCLEGLGWAYCLVEKITTFGMKSLPFQLQGFTPRSTDYANS